MAVNSTSSAKSDPDGLRTSETVNLYKLYGGALGGNTVIKNKDIGCDVFEFDSSKGGRDVSNIRMKEPMSPLLNYFELEILDEGRSTAIGIGVCHSDYPLSRMPGWNANSIGYHADDGKLFHQAGWGSAFGPTCKRGDRMGVGIDFETECGVGNVKVWFTKNGEMVGGRAIQVLRPVKGLYPIIGMHSHKECVRYLGHSQRPPNCGDGCASVMHVNNSHPLSYWARCNGIVFANNPLCLSFKGAVRGDVGLVVGTSLITPANHYFEVYIEDGGRDNAIGIGIGPHSYPPDSYPGWRTNSIGYHADNGNMYKQRGNGDHFGPTCTTGDTMGCGVIFHEETAKKTKDDSEDEDLSGLKDMTNHLQPTITPYIAGPFLDTSLEGRNCTVFFTRNGTRLGECDFVVPKGGIFPIIGMSSPGEKVLVTFDPLSG